jgi:SGNH domain (fused to AT3 domains)
VNEPIGVQLIGDSFAEHYVAAVDPVAKDAGVRGEAYTEEGCPMLAGLVRTGFDGTTKCKVQRDKYLDAIRRNNSPLVLSQSWLTYGDSVHSELRGSAPRASWIEVWRGGIEDTIRDLGVSGRQFMIIAPGVEPGCRSQMTRFAPGPLWHAPTKPCPRFRRSRSKPETRISTQCCWMFSSATATRCVFCFRKNICAMPIARLK